MLYFFKIIFENRRHLLLFLLSFVVMVALLISSYLEVFTLGLITSGTQDLEALFSSKTSGLTKTLFPTGNNFIRDITQWLHSYIFSSNNLKSLVVFLVFVAVFKAISQFFQSFINKMVAAKVAQSLRLKYFQHIQSLPMSFYHRYNIGSLSSRVVGDSLAIAEAVNSTLINYIQTPIYLVCTLYICVLTSGRLSLLVFGSIPIVGISITFIASAIKRVAKKIQKNQESFTSVLIDFLSGIHTVKIYVMEHFTLKKYAEQNEIMADLEIKNAKYDSFSRPTIHLISSSFLALILLYGLYVVKLSLSELVVFIGLLNFVYEPVKKFAEENAHIQRGVAAAERMYEVMGLKPEIVDKEDAIELKDFRESLRFEKVWFKYHENWVLKDLSFEVKKGETLAIVGPTGAGKSTIVELVPRLYDVQKGEVYLDGLALKDYQQKSLRQQIAFVPQRPFLFLDTVFENIAYGCKFTPEQVQKAAKEAYADEFIQKLPGNYHFCLEEGGKNLSGGQQQRLAISRALVKQAPILIMDEATSALDALSEGHIQKAIKELKGKVTQIIIAHRFSTIMHADKILYLDDGKKVAMGTKEELLETCPPFKAMWETLNREAS